MAERERWDIGEFQDEGLSAYTGNRGPGIDRAKALAIDTARDPANASWSPRTPTGSPAVPATPPVHPTTWARSSSP
jgi:hypothetical protein